MRLHALLIVMIFLGLAAVAVGDDADKAIQDKLQGKWKMIALIVDGNEVPEDAVKEIRLTVKGTDYHVHKSDDVLKMTFKLLPKTKPQAIDVTYTEGDKKGKTNKAIMQLEGDTFKMCRHVEPENERPTDFASKAQSKLVLTTWKRDKD